MRKLGTLGLLTGTQLFTPSQFREIRSAEALAQTSDLISPHFHFRKFDEDRGQEEQEFITSDV